MINRRKEASTADLRPYVCRDHGGRFSELEAWEHLRDWHPEHVERLRGVQLRAIPTTAVETPEP